MSRFQKIRPPRGVDPELQNLYDVVNRLIAAVNKYESEDEKKTTPETKGATGDLKIVKRVERDTTTDQDVTKYLVKGRFEDGWKEVELG